MRCVSSLLNFSGRNVRNGAGHVTCVPPRFGDVDLPFVENRLESSDTFDTFRCIQALREVKVLNLRYSLGRHSRRTGPKEGRSNLNSSLKARDAKGDRCNVHQKGIDLRILNYDTFRREDNRLATADRRIRERSGTPDLRRFSPVLLEDICVAKECPATSRYAQFSPATRSF